jgi:hypothetical protein
MDSTLIPSIQQHLKTQHGLHAFASMVITNLPFPPLPIMVRTGDGEEGVGSSFDLFNQAVIAMSMAGDHASLSKDELVANKTVTLTTLHTNMACHYSRHLLDNAKCKANNPPSKAWILEAYGIYCNSFRDYLLKNYAVTSQDLRFMPMESVDKDSVVMEHAKSHVKGSFMLAIGAKEEDVPTLPTYTDVIRYYAVDLATLPCADRE